MPLCGAGIFFFFFAQIPANLSPARGSWGSELGGWTYWGRTMSVVLQLRQLFFFSPCAAHGSVPAVLQRKAPLPPLCIMTNQGRQAAVPLAHHSTASLPWENKLKKKKLRTHTRYICKKQQQNKDTTISSLVNQVAGRKGLKSVTLCRQQEPC